MPPLTKHCRLCEACCEGFDHHCLWLMRCIGRGNHCQFVVFCFLLGVCNFLFVISGGQCEFNNYTSHTITSTVLFLAAVYHSGFSCGKHIPKIFFQLPDVSAACCCLNHCLWLIRCIRRGNHCQFVVFCFLGVCNFLFGISGRQCGLH